MKHEGFAEQERKIKRELETCLPSARSYWERKLSDLQNSRDRWAGQMLVPPVMPATPYKRRDFTRRLAKAYLRDHPHASTKEIADALGMRYNRIYHVLRGKGARGIKKNSIALRVYNILKDQQEHSTEEILECGVKSAVFAAISRLRETFRILHISDGRKHSYRLTGRIV